MKTIEALNALAALNSITAAKTPCPVKFAYASSINRKRLGEVAEAFEEARKGLLDKHGEKDAEGKLVQNEGNVTLADPEAFRKDYTELADGDTEVKLHMVKLDAFPAEIALGDMEALMCMVAEEAAA
jgi:hypothetical protein